MGKVKIYIYIFAEKKLYIYVQYICNTYIYNSLYIYIIKIMCSYRFIKNLNKLFSQLILK